MIGRVVKGGHAVKESKHTEEQIAFALKQAELGTPERGVSQDGHFRRDVLVFGTSAAEQALELVLDLILDLRLDLFGFFLDHRLGGAGRNAAEVDLVLRCAK